jgi:hypothetical protein
LGSTVIKSRLQNALDGPRFSIPVHALSGKLASFVETQFGSSGLKQTISRSVAGTESSSASGFSWMLGGGLDYLITPHWAGRVNLDFLRTHIADEAQSRLRVVLDVA